MLAKNIMLFAPEKVLKPTCKGRRVGPVYILDIFVIFQISITHQHLFTKHNQYSAPGANLVPVTATVTLHLSKHYDCRWKVR